MSITTTLFRPTMLGFITIVLAMLVASCSSSPDAESERADSDERLPQLPSAGDHGHFTCEPDEVPTLSELLARNDFVAIATVDSLEPVFSPVTIEAAPRTQPPRWQGSEDDCPGEMFPGFAIGFSGVEVLSGEIPPWVEDRLLVLYNFDGLSSRPRLDDRGDIYWSDLSAGSVAPGHRLLIMAVCDEQLGLCVHNEVFLGELDNGELNVPRHEASCLPDMGHTTVQLAARIDESEVQSLRDDPGNVRGLIRDANLTMYADLFASCVVHDRSVQGFPEPHRCASDADCEALYTGGFCRRDACHNPSDFGLRGQ